MWHAIYLVHTDFINSYWIVNAVKLRLKDKFKQSCHTSIQNLPKTLFYRCFKEAFEFEKKIFRNSGSRILIRLFQIRTSNHKLPIECGRWQNIERNRRLCNLR